LIKKVVNLLFKDQNQISGNLIIPEKSTGIVIFAHGSGSTGTSYRNQVLGQALNNNGFSTLLFDLLTEGEKQIDSKCENIAGKIPGITLNKFNIKLLTQRLISITEWVQKNNDTENLDIGYFGASTGTAAALYAVTAFYDIKVLVSRSGRSDLVDKKTLSDITCPCLFIVGEYDKKVIDINKKTVHELKNVKDKKIEIMEGASHLFEEQGKIKEVADLSVYWFKRYLGRI
jgi:putative phosphoribosyl transferase